MTRPHSNGRFGYLFDLIGDPVVEIELVDQTPVVRSVNPAFEDVFGYDREEIYGSSLNQYILPEAADDRSEQFDQRTAEGKPNTGLVTRQTAAGLREFFYRGIPYERDGDQYGLAIYTDVTDERRYERHLEVVHRLFRHDLRNDLQVIIGTATEVEKQAADSDVADLARRIVARAEQITDVGREAQRIEQVLLDDEEPKSVDLAELCRTAVRERRPFDEVSVSVDVPAEIRAQSTGQLRTAIEALLDNAVEHGGQSVLLYVTRVGDEAVVGVADDGDGIPEEHRGPVFENHAITGLRHSRGLGLWLVRWVAEASGGRIRYHRDDGVTTVSMALKATTNSPDRSAKAEG